MTKYALYINYEYCSGCHSCELACRNEKEIPLGDFGIKVLEDRPRQHADGSWHWDYIAYPTELCDLCEGRIAEGKLPSCVQMCQAKCLHYAPVEECAKMLVEKGSKAAIFLP